MKFACKLIHGGPLHPCYEPVHVEALSVGALKQKIKKIIIKK